METDIGFSSALDNNESGIFDDALPTCNLSITYPASKNQLEDHTIIPFKASILTLVKGWNNPHVSGYSTYDPSFPAPNIADATAEKFYDGKFALAYIHHTHGQTFPCYSKTRTAQMLCVQCSWN